jgi:hypothetical protein
MDTERFQQKWVDRFHSRGKTTQTSYRLPIYLQAQIDAICELYPNMNRTAIVADLLIEAIRDFDGKLPTNPESVRGNVDPQPGGLRGQFRRTANSKFKELEGGGYFEPIYLLTQGFPDPEGLPEKP